MPRPTKGPRLGSGPSHEKQILSGLVAALIREERIRTTETKAKRARPLAEKLITLGKSGDVHARRQALAVIEDRDIIHKLFDEIAPRFTDRNGGYTRILKLGPRQGDAAPMAILEWVEGEAPAKAAPTEEQAKKRRVLGRRKKAEDTKPKAAEAIEEGDVPEPAEELADEDPQAGAAAEGIEEAAAEHTAEAEASVVEAEALAEPQPDAVADGEPEAPASDEASEETQKK